MIDFIDLKDNSIDRWITIRLVAFDFDGVFTDNSVWVLENGTEAVRCSRSDGLGLQKLNRLDIANLIISTETNPVVSTRSRKLKIRCIQGCKDKLEALKNVAEEHKLALSKVAFVGNDINDVDCLKTVGLPIVVSDAHKDVLPYAAYVTQCRGGHGAVREICDLIAHLHDLYK